MAVNKPSVGQTNWGPTLNSALDSLDERITDLEDGADFTFTLETGDGTTSFMTVNNHDMEIRTTRDDNQDADISINSADDIWVTANDSIEIASTTNDVTVYTNDFSNGWAFESGGGFRFPDGTVQTTASGVLQASPNMESVIVANNATEITLTLNDANKFFYVASDENHWWQQFNVPTDSQVAFPIGTVITFVLIDATVIAREVYDENTDTRSNVYGEGQGTSTDYMFFTGTGVVRLIKFASNQWILAGNNIYRD